VRERLCVCVCVCVCEREREREREREQLQKYMWILINMYTVNSLKSEVLRLPVCTSFYMCASNYSFMLLQLQVAIIHMQGSCLYSPFSKK
jgi:hypothetical protein